MGVVRLGGARWRLDDPVQQVRKGTPSLSSEMDDMIKFPPSLVESEWEYPLVGRFRAMARVSATKHGRVS